MHVLTFESTQPCILDEALSHIRTAKSIQPCYINVLCLCVRAEVCRPHCRRVPLQAPRLQQRRVSAAAAAVWDTGYSRFPHVVQLRIVLADLKGTNPKRKKQTDGAENAATGSTPQKPPKKAAKGKAAPKKGK